MTKTELRAEIKRRLENIDERERRDAAIADKLFGLSEYKRAGSLCVYKSFGTETGTQAIVAAALAEGKRVYVPKICGDTLMTAEITADTVFKRGAFGIEEPIAVSGDFDFDLCVVPLLGFSAERERLGRGKGFYDRFLSEKNCYSVAIGYDAQEIERGFSEPHDVKPDVIITESGIISGDGR